MSELTVAVLRLGLLAALWVFVFSIVTVLRSDLYGTRIVTRREARGDARVDQPRQHTAGRSGGMVHTRLEAVHQVIRSAPAEVTAVHQQDVATHPEHCRRADHREHREQFGHPGHQAAANRLNMFYAAR